MHGEARDQYEKALIACKNRQKLYKYIKCLQSLPPVMKSEARHGKARIDENTARVIYKFFVSVVTDEDYALFEPSRSYLYGKNEVDMGEAGMMTELKKLDTNESQRNDSLPPILLKKSRVVFRHLSRNSSTILKDCKGSNSLEKSIVSPIFKDGDRNEVSYYRPVTLLKMILKFFEKFFFRAIAEAFITTISENQKSFQPRGSVVFQLQYS